MQYVGKVGGYMYNQWNSLNPATLSGAIDIIVIEQPDGSLHCSPFHVRFGKFQIIKPSQKKIDLFVNDMKTDLPMKLGDGGEGFFVFETTNSDFISQSAMTSPVISPSSSPETSPSLDPSGTGTSDFGGDLEGFDLNSTQSKSSAYDDDIDSKIKLSNSKPSTPDSFERGPTPTPSITSAFETARKVTQKLNIPSKIDVNGDMVLDMDGYKPNSQKNIDNTDEMVKKILIEELENLRQDGDNVSEMNLWDQIIKMDENGNLRISNIDDQETDELTAAETEHLNKVIAEQQQDLTNSSLNVDDEKTYFKTLRLTSEQLQKMNLQYGENKLMFKLNQGNSQVAASLHLWKSTTPIVISDIDGTITKSDALGHVLNLIGKDWTHAGVATLFTDIQNNGYNIMYLTARSVGQADSTRAYLKSIIQENNTRLPAGPVILSPDRTMAALKREVILKKPEVFKMSCLNDIKSLYYSSHELQQMRSQSTTSTDNSTKDDQLYDKDRTPFYAGFGNKITDAISYRSVNIPSHRIFTINPEGDVHLELLELSGVKSSYLGIGELVDQYFPPIGELGNYSSLSNPNQSNGFTTKRAEERFNDVNYWREPMNLSDLSDIEEDEPIPEPRSPSLLSMRSFGSDSGSIDKPESKERETKERPKSMSSFASPLKGLMRFRSNEADDSFDYGDKEDDIPLQDLDIDQEDIDNIPDLDTDIIPGENNLNEDDYTEDDYDDDDYDEDADDDYIDEEDGEEDDFDEEQDEDEDEGDEGDLEDDYEDEEDFDEEDPKSLNSQPVPLPETPTIQKASDLLKSMNLEDKSQA